MHNLAPRLRFATIGLATGIRLHYAEQGDASGEALVCLHGYADSSFSFSRLLPLLPASFHVLALDQRGHGDSDRPPGGYAIDDFAADVVAFLDSVGLIPATLIGHSLGTFVARRVAERHPERVARLVLIDSAVSPVNDVMLEVRDAVRDLPEPVPADFVREFQASTAHLPLPVRFLDRVVAESLKMPARVWRDAWDGLLAFDDAAELGRIAAPTLLLWGEHDAMFGRADQERLLAAIAGARLTAYPQTGHTPHWERPEQVAADLEAFLRAATPAPQGAPA